MTKQDYLRRCDEQPQPSKLSATILYWLAGLAGAVLVAVLRGLL